MLKILKTLSLSSVILVISPNLAYSQKKESKQTVDQAQVNQNRLSSLTLRIAVPFFTILDKELDSVKGVRELNNNVKNRLKSVNRYEVKELRETTNDTKLLTSDQIVPLGKNNGLDVILTGSIAKMDNDILINLHL